MTQMPIVWDLPAHVDLHAVLRQFRNQKLTVSYPWEWHKDDTENRKTLDMLSLRTKLFSLSGDPLHMTICQKSAHTALAVKACFLGGKQLQLH